MRFADYDPGDFFDEMFDTAHQARDSARALAQFVETLPDGELLRRQRSAERALLNLGITFGVYGDLAGNERIFPFDLVPRIVAAQEWRFIERGLKQRITALNMFIDDVYHEQAILKDGVVPAEIVRSATTFREACVGLNPPRGIWCHITGTDLVRDRDGRIYVLEDNLRCPSGVSYVLQNRLIIKRTFPQLFESFRIRPVDDYASRLRDMLESLSPADVETPRVVVLTPGPYNSAYFEHSFLAQQMGVELVEGRDLVVSDGFVWMRTTKGFERVDVIYRRMDDDFIDPAVFRADSVLGVPGLFEVYRNGRVALANAPGTGVADDKVIYAYVPQIVKYYLDEEIILPNVPTFLCAYDEQRQHVLANLETLVVKAANESGGYGMLVGPQSTREERTEFSRRIEAAPRNYIAQPTLSLSRVPTIVDGAFQGRHVDLRPYILFGEEIFVLPGGLTRVALRQGSLVVNSSQGGGSKDTWVLVEDNDTANVPVDGPERDAQVQSQSQSGAAAMLSRVAESIYWMSRYIERADNVARFVDVTLNLILDMPFGSIQQWQPLVDTTGDTKDFARRYGTATQQRVIHFLTFDQDNPSSIYSCLRAARDNARSVREIISSEMWEQVNQFYLKVNAAATDPRSLGDPHQLFTSVKMSSHTFAGVTDATMTHNEAWHFCRLGRHLERADKTSRILDVKYFLLLPNAADVGTTYDDIQWAAVLRSASAFEMYRKRHGRISPGRIVEFLLLDREFPRAIQWCLMETRESAHAISGTPAGMFRTPVEHVLGEVCSELAYAQADDIVTGGLHEYLDNLQTRMNMVGAGIHDTFFAQHLLRPPERRAVKRKPGSRPAV